MRDQIQNFKKKSQTQNIYLNKNSLKILDIPTKINFTFKQKIFFKIVEIHNFYLSSYWLYYVNAFLLSSK